MIDILTAGGEIITENGDPSELYCIGMDYDQICGVVDGLADTKTDEIEYSGYVIRINDRFLYDLGVSTAVEGGGLDYKDIASILGISEGAVGQAIDRAKRKLKKSGLLRDLLRNISALHRNDWSEITITERITIYG